MAPQNAEASWCPRQARAVVWRSQLQSPRVVSPRPVAGPCPTHLRDVYGFSKVTDSKQPEGPFLRAEKAEECQEGAPKRAENSKQVLKGMWEPSQPLDPSQRIPTRLAIFPQNCRRAGHILLGHSSVQVRECLKAMACRDGSPAQLLKGSLPSNKLQVWVGCDSQTWCPLFSQRLSETWCPLFSQRPRS